VTDVLAGTRSLTKSFGENLAVDQVGISVSAGEVVGLVGANGAGKTTLIRMLLGLLIPDDGHVHLFGVPPARAVRRRIGYMPQGLGLYEDLTVEENLRFRASVFGVPAPELDDDLAILGPTLVADLPLGLRRRVAFVAALAHRPELLILDEPTSGVGPLGRAGLWETIHQAADAGAGILVTTHHMDEAEQCDRLVFLSVGREAFSGTVAEILAGRTTVEVAPSNPSATLSVLEEAGLPVLPAGSRLRIPGARLGDVQRLVAEETTIRQTPASLEEAFMTLVAAP
jgi:ABC-2 type transport system ATP-binding protein/ribosome-dependent ATPase